MALSWRKIPQLFQCLRVISARGMVLAIPLGLAHHMDQERGAFKEFGGQALSVEPGRSSAARSSTGMPEI